MSATPRIALVWALPPPAAAILGPLAERSPPAVVRTFADLLADAAEIRRFRPDLIVLAHEAPGAEDAGMLRVLCALAGGSAALVAAPEQGREAAAAAARRLGAPLLALPAPPEAVRAAVEHALQRPSPDRQHLLLNLVRGVADEIHNPLQVALGHVRLLAEDLPAGSATGAKVEAIRRGLQRIEGTVRRAQLLQRAQALGSPAAAVDLAALAAEVAGGEPGPPAVVRGDPDLLRQALRDLLALGYDLAPAGQPPALRAAAQDDRVLVRLDLPAVKIEDWRLPRTFEPYYLDSLLRGTSHGLGAFTIRIIAEAHGGRALARRRPEGGFAIDLELPAR